MSEIRYQLPVQPGGVTRADHEAAVNGALSGLAARIDALTGGVRVLGNWDPGSGAFPATRPDGGAILAGDAWIVAAAGAVDGESFAPVDRLIALAAGGGASYAGNWLRAPYADLLDGFASMPAGAVAEPVYASRGIASLREIGPGNEALLVLGADPSGSGRAAYRRTAADPGHPGSFRTLDRYLPGGAVDEANGGWWELSETVVKLQQFGGVPSTPEAPVFADDALDAAVDYCHKTGASLQVEGMFVLNELHEYAHGIHMFGRIEIRLSNELPTKYVAGFYCNVGAGIHFASAGTVGFGLVERLSFIDSANTPLPPNRQSYDKVPMLGFGRGSSWQWRSLRFRGMDRRWCNFRAGMTGAVWNHIFEKIDTHGAQIGAWIGGESDNTDNVIVGCTFHHCKTVGVIIQNPSGGFMSGSSSEWNDGPVGVYLMSYDFGEDHRARNFRISENYIFRQSGDEAAYDLDGSCAVQVGGTLVWSDFTPVEEGDPEDEITSNMTPEAIVIDNNYLVAQFSRHAVRFDSGRRGCRMTNNIVMSLWDTDPTDVLLHASGVIVDFNTNQNEGKSDQISKKSTVHGYYYQLGRTNGTMGFLSKLITLEPGAVLEFYSGSDGRSAQMTQLGLSMGIGGSAAFREHAAVKTKTFESAPPTGTVIITPDDIPGSASGIIRVLVAVSQTNKSSQGAIDFTYGVLNGSAFLTVHSNEGSTNNLTLVGKNVVLDRVSPWNAIVVVTGAGTPWNGIA